MSKKYGSRECAPQSAADTFLIVALGQRATIVLVVALTALALSLRLTRLDASGFSEDELEKFEATRSYAQHEFSTDADHPMLTRFLAPSWRATGSLLARCFLWLCLSLRRSRRRSSHQAILTPLMQSAAFKARAVCIRSAPTIWDATCLAG